MPPSRDEIRDLAETLNEMLARLEAALEHERRFVADASHELRTPLALLKAELELALRRPRTAEELRAAVGSAAEETDRLVVLAEDLLLIARSDQEALGLRVEPVDLGALARSTAERFAERASTDHRRVDVEIPPRTEVSADRLRLEQALRNLVDNALGYGEGRVTITTRRMSATRSRSTSSTRARGSRRRSRRARSSGSPAVTTRAHAVAAGSASRSSRQSRRHTAARWESRRTGTGRTSGSRFPATRSPERLSSGSHLGRLPSGAMESPDTRAHARRRKEQRLGILRRRAALASALGFAAFVGLAAQHAVGSAKHAATRVTRRRASQPRRGTSTSSRAARHSATPPRRRSPPVAQTHVS